MVANPSISTVEALRAQFERKNAELNEKRNARVAAVTSEPAALYASRRESIEVHLSEVTARLAVAAASCSNKIAGGAF
jgi:hypothetical protein